jgi:hypothetical protein
MKAELERLRAENEALKKSGRSKLAMKVSEKGALSVYGMGRFPVTLYKEQWLKLLDLGEEIRGFIREHEAELGRCRWAAVVPDPATDEAAREVTSRARPAEVEVGFFYDLAAARRWVDGRS